jgi:hypothetical protein
MSQIKNDCQNKDHHHKGRYCLHRLLLIYRLSEVDETARSGGAANYVRATDPDSPSGVITKVSEAFTETDRGINLEQGLPWHPGSYLPDL